MRDSSPRPLSDVIRIKHGYAFNGSEFIDDPEFPTVLTPGNFQVGGGFKQAKPKTFAGQVPDGYMLERGDLVVTMTDLSREGDTLGLPAVIPESGRYLHNQRIGLVEVLDVEAVDLGFLNYFLRTREYRGYVLSSATGSTVRHTSPARIGTFQAELPPVAEQRAIAGVLGALDDKIAANLRLAEVADEWVRARLNSLPAVGVKRIGELVENRREIVDPSRVHPDMPYVGLEHIPRHHMWLHSSGIAGGVSSSKARFLAGDILFGKLRPYFHKVVGAPVDGICSTDVLVLKPKMIELGDAAVAIIASDTVVASATSASEGTRMPRTSWKDLAAIEIAWPGHAAALEFSKDVHCIRAAVENKVQENRIIAVMRDTLLPELMSGRLGARDAEKTVEAVI